MEVVEVSDIASALRTLEFASSATPRLRPLD
jgi:hypothetical protein